MSVTIEEIEKLATLARIELSQAEKEKLRVDIGAILEYVSQIKEVSAKTAEKPSDYFVASVNVMREDANPHGTGIYTDALLDAAPQREEQYIRVKKIL